MFKIERQWGYYVSEAELRKTARLDFLFFHQSGPDSFSKHRNPQGVMNITQAVPRFIGLAVMGSLLAAPVRAQYATQAVSLSNGWNGVYFEVAPEDPGCDAVFADWPVASVSAYVAGSLRSGYTDGTGTNQVPLTEYLTWQPGQPPGVNSLNAVMAGKAYLIFATGACQRVLTGRPAAPRIEWVPGPAGSEVHQLVGFQTDGTAKFGKFLAGAGFNMAALSVYTVGGTNIPGPTRFKVGWTTASLEPIAKGRAYLIAGDKVSGFSGPLNVSPVNGLYFPTNSSRDVLKLRNDHHSNLAVTVTAEFSAPDAAGIQPAMPDLWFFDSTAGWTNVVPPKTLSPGEEWTIPVAVNRTGMAASNRYGAVLVCADDAGGRVAVPLEAEYASPDPAHALWPAGLWVGDAHLDRVSQVLDDGQIKEGVEAGSTLDLRLILHVDKSNRCRLLQRVILSGAEDTNGNWSASLYTDESRVPAAQKSVRISSVAFGLNHAGIHWDDTFGGFGDQLRFTYVIATNDPVNPFRHPYHPGHDGLAADFETPLPSGDELGNYMAAIKPELFSISNEVRLIWSEAPAPGGGFIGWNPAEAVTGAVEFIVGGLRREGPVTMAGRFELRRISKMGVLSTE